MLRQANIVVSGNVQGVFYRVWTKQQAEELVLSGFARNEPGGVVRIEVEGEEEKIQELIDRCYEGPELAKVKDVQVEWTEYEGKFTGFSIQ
jgi:acylphosphatase